MPGDVVEFAPGPEALRLVGVLSGLTDHPTLDFVLIGGLAVAARLRTFHRATQDLDALVDADREQFQAMTIETLTNASIDGGHLRVDGVRVDVIDVDTATPDVAIAELADPIDRLFAAAHLFAISDATTVTIQCGAAVATVAVASARSLLVTKLHAYLNPRRDRRKHGSDALDLLELGRQVVTGPGHLGLATMPVLTREVASWGITQIRSQPEAMVRRLVGVGRPTAVAEVSALLDLTLDDLAG